MLSEEIKKRMLQAMKSGDTLEKEILRVALGEIQTQEARASKAMSDEEVAAVLRKLVKNNQETLGVSERAEQKDQLAKEIAILESLLPKALGVDEIVAALAPVRDAVKAAGNDGQATGVAMKHLKSAGAVVTGKEVTEAVKRLRAG
ncbi:MAG: GatB/YqeY domain-containing protein [Polyangiaceae bacterium]|nr:GatB/YqeY domain-containing protein [Polyangiaceae bacterium]MCL4755469.1 GatB/YqeY domain-containing protein [Myxococcales bacterium]